jgi:hypothetical protein
MNPIKTGLTAEKNVNYFIHKHIPHPDILERERWSQEQAV